MRKLLAFTLLSVTLAAGLTAGASDRVPGQLVVQLRPHSSVVALSKAYGLRVLATSSFSNLVLLGAGNNTNLASLAARVARDARVLSASPNWTARSQDGSATPSTTPIKDQWVIGSDGTDGITFYDSQPALGQINYGPISQRYSGAGVTVAILDTGISNQNPNLVAPVAPGWNYIDNNSNTNDVPANLTTYQAGTSDHVAGHGTMVAGLVARYAPGATLLPVKVLNSDGQGSLWTVTQGISFAMSKHAKVFNLSFGMTQPSTVLDKAIAAAVNGGAVIVTSAGNLNSSAPQYPASNPNVITVGGLNGDNTKSGFSNYGSSVAVDAPSVGLISTFWDGRFAAWSGTSFSAPIVSAEAALLFSQGATSLSVKSRIRNTSHSVDSANPAYQGQLGKSNQGLIDFDWALSGN